MNSAENMSECHLLYYWVLPSRLIISIHFFRWKGTMTGRKRTTMKVTEKTRSHSARIWHHHPVPSTTAATRLTMKRTQTATSDYNITMATNPGFIITCIHIHDHQIKTHNIVFPLLLLPDFYCAFLATHWFCNSTRYPPKSPNEHSLQ